MKWPYLSSGAGFACYEFTSLLKIFKMHNLLKYLDINVCAVFSFLFKPQDYKTIADSAEPHLLLDVRPLVEVDICHLPFSLSILCVRRPFKQSHLISDYPCVFAVLILFPDIPLSCLEERRSEHLRLLKEQISQLKGQMSGDCLPAGNVKTPFKAPTCCIFTVHCVVWYRLILASLLQVVTGLLGDPLFSKTSAASQPEQLAWFKEINMQNLQHVWLSVSAS